MPDSPLDSEPESRGAAAVFPLLMRSLYSPGNPKGNISDGGAPSQADACQGALSVTDMSQEGFFRGLDALILLTLLGVNGTHGHGAA